jgi:hypothetical protein
MPHLQRGPLLFFDSSERNHFVRPTDVGHHFISKAVHYTVRGSIVSFPPWGTSIDIGRMHSAHDARRRGGWCYNVGLSLFSNEENLCLLYILGTTRLPPLHTAVAAPPRKPQFLETSPPMCGSSPPSPVSPPAPYASPYHGSRTYSMIRDLLRRAPTVSDG